MNEVIAMLVAVYMLADDEMQIKVSSFGHYTIDRCNERKAFYDEHEPSRTVAR